MTFRMSVRNAFTFFFAGRVRKCPWYLRTWCPRKSNPSSMCVMLVFSSESSNPRSRRNSVTRDLTSCSRTSFEIPVMRKSSQSRTRLTCLFMPFRALGPECGYFLRSIRSSPSSAILARTGELTPPTKLPTFFFGVRIVRVRIDPKHDIDLIPGDFHPLHQGPDEIPLARPVGCLQSAVDFGRKIFESANNQLEFRLQGRLIRPRLTLLFQASEALTEAGNPGLELVLVDEALCIAVKQPGDAVPELADLRFPRGQGRACGPRLRL